MVDQWNKGYEELIGKRLFWNSWLTQGRAILFVSFVIEHPLVLGIIYCINKFWRLFSQDSNIFSLLLGFIPCKAEQPLQGMELQWKEIEKDNVHIQGKEVQKYKKQKIKSGRLFVHAPILQVIFVTLTENSSY